MRHRLELVPGEWLMGPDACAGWPLADAGAVPRRRNLPGGDYCRIPLAEIQRRIIQIRILGDFSGPVNLILKSAKDGVERFRGEAV